MNAKGQMQMGGGPKLSAAKQFYDPDISVPIASLSYPYERGTLRNAQAVGSYERRLQALAKPRFSP